jgi:hypothetical protein
MSTDADSIELQTHDERVELSLVEVKRFGSSNNFRCTLRVRSGGFACERPFYFDAPYLTQAIAGLNRMLAGEPGKAVLRSTYEEDRLEFEMNRLGHVVVSGEVVEHAELSQSLSFAFRTDQTVLGPLARALEAVNAA